MSDALKADDPPALFAALLKADFPLFLGKAYPAIRGGDPLLWNWHLDAVAFQLSRIDTGQCQRLLVTLPPRNLKSITISVAWVAWMLGRDPTRSFVCVSYSNELSAKLARDCLALMETGWYRELFPRTVVSRRRSATADFETTRGGGRLATSVGGTLTGRGGDIIVIDDPIKPEEAHSETTRNAVNHWFRSTLASRLNDKGSGAIVTVMQRLHQDDLAGTLIEAGGWDLLSLPAIAQEDEIIPLPRGRKHRRCVGDVLHPARESLAVLERQRADMGSIAFNAQYLQDPVPATGNVIRAEWLRTTNAGFSPSAPGTIVQSWDTAVKTGESNDWSVCITAHLSPGNVIHVLDVFRARLEFPELKRAAVRLAREHRATTMLVEDKASGTQLIQTLRNADLQGVPSPIRINPEGDKTSRMQGASAAIEAGDLRIPADAPWLADFTSEILGFPNARHDDQADALSQLINWVTRRGSWDAADTPAGPIIPDAPSGLGSY